MSFSFKQGITDSYSFSETSSYSYTNEFGVSVEASVEVEVGAIFAKASATFSLGLSYTMSYESSHSKTYGKDQSITNEWSFDSPIVVPGGKVYMCQASAKKAKI